MKDVPALRKEPPLPLNIQNQESRGGLWHPLLSFFS